MAYVCNACLEPIQIGASICPHCRTRRWGSDQESPQTVYVVQQESSGSYPSAPYRFDENNSPWEWFYILFALLYGMSLPFMWLLSSKPVFSLDNQLFLCQMLYLCCWPAFVVTLIFYPWHLHAEYNNWVKDPGAGFFVWPQLLIYVGLNVGFTEFLHADVYTPNMQTNIMAACTLMFIGTYYCFPKLKH